MPPIVHVSTAIIALLLGATVLATPKGTTRHRRLGASYATTLLLANVGALTMTGDSGRFGAFQLLAVLSPGTLLVGLGLIRRRARTEQVSATHAIIMGFAGQVVTLGVPFATMPTSVCQVLTGARRSLAPPPTSISQAKGSTPIVAGS